MTNILDANNKSSYISKRYIRVEDLADVFQIETDDMRALAIAAGALYRLPRT